MLLLTMRVTAKTFIFIHSCSLSMQSLNGEKIMSSRKLWHIDLAMDKTTKIATAILTQIFAEVITEIHNPTTR